tara:strand:- start:47 stop:1849 length:1803 start_codon:yes stop_codon:yes gene_type:complete
MPGLSDLKIKIGAKKEPHDLAWINDKERSVLKAMGGSGKPGPMGIPAYDVGAADDEAASTSGGPGAEPSEGEGGGWDEPGGYSKPGKDIEKGWDNPYEPGALGNVLGFIGDAIGAGFKSSAFGKVNMGVGEKLGGKGEELSPDDLRELDRISWEELSGPAKDPDRDGINDGSEIVNEIIKKEEEVEEELTPMQKYFKDIQSATKNDIGFSQMTPEEKLITSLGIQNRVIEPFEQWLATQEEAVQNLPKWLQSTKYREYAKNRTSPAQSYQPSTASMMASTEAIKDKTPATTELFNRLGMSSNIATAKGGGQILDNLVQRQTGGPTYDPVREAEAEKRARELQAIKVGELDEAPQTRAEREALQASGGMYRDEEGAVRDAQGNVQEDFGFDYTAPPEPGRPDPVNTPDTPKWEPPKVIEPVDTTPLPPGLVRNPETGEVTIDKEAAKEWHTMGGWQNVDADDNANDPWDTAVWDEQDYLKTAWGKGSRNTGLDQGDLGGGWNISRKELAQHTGNAYTPEHFSYALQGPSITFLPTPTPTPTPMPLGPNISLGPQQQPTGLQSLPQQGMPGFGMQSPTPFGTQQPFSSGFGQQPNYNSPYAR